MTTKTDRPGMTDPQNLADCVLQQAMALMEAKGVPLEVILDRLTTFAAGAHVTIVGEHDAAVCFHAYADRIADGLFSPCEPSLSRRQH